jgi:hypothetical protein
MEGTLSEEEKLTLWIPRASLCSYAAVSSIVPNSSMLPRTTDELVSETRPNMSWERRTDVVGEAISETSMMVCVNGAEGVPVGNVYQWRWPAGMRGQNIE